METVFLQFDRSFDFFLANDRKGARIPYDLSRNASVKDMIESAGVPHTEVGAIFFNGREISFSDIPSLPGTVTVKGITPPLDMTVPSLLRPHPINRIRFIADVNVIRLGRLMILLGFDVAFSSAWSDRVIADMAEAENRIVLTRDTDLLKRKKIDFAKRIRADLPYDQLTETIQFFGLEEQIFFFSRCTLCNVWLEKKTKDQVIHLLEPKTKKYFHTFFQCPQCKKVFWRGSHYDNIKKTLSQAGISIRE